MPPPFPPYHPPLNSSRTLKEFDDFVCIFPGTSDVIQLSFKTVSCFEGCRFETGNKKIDLITGPKLGGGARGGLMRFSQKAKFDLFFFLKPSLTVIFVSLWWSKI